MQQPSVQLFRLMPVRPPVRLVVFSLLSKNFLQVLKSVCSSMFVGVVLFLWLAENNKTEGWNASKSLDSDVWCLLNSFSKRSCVEVTHLGSSSWSPRPLPVTLKELGACHSGKEMLLFLAFFFFIYPLIRINRTIYCWKTNKSKYFTFSYMVLIGKLVLQLSFGYISFAKCLVQGFWCQDKWHFLHRSWIS